MRKFFWVALLLGIFGSSSPAEDTKFTALYIVNFAKYVEWAGDQASGDFVITVLGEDPVFDALKGLTATLSIGSQKVVVNQVQSLDKVPKSQILYISPDNSNQLASARDKFTSQTLIVTNKDGLGKAGAGINIVTIDGKMKFEINTESLKKNGLGAKPVLFKLGTAITS